MNYDQRKLPQVYLNVMEILVQEEIEKKLKSYPSNIKCYMNKIEIATYALNRLPPLYASSEQGKEQQLKLGKQKYKNEIPTAVRFALAAVERDPLRKSIPLLSIDDVQHKLAEMALKKLENLLYQHRLLTHNQQISWNNLSDFVQQALKKIAWRDNQHSELTNDSQLTYKHSLDYPSDSLKDGFNCSLYQR